MPWRPLMRYLSNNEELIRRLSESYPIRRAAQLTAYFLNVGKDKFIEHQDTWEKYKELRRQQEKSRTSSSTTTKATTKNKKPFS
ncbi:unnamed protein product [Rotaria sp. Silwood1]|nr:unnamed protein product [Rotaria sp. Silwood1]CAF0837771.1 unnamed protein product [Rotaria sp. Silwood1]CAF0934973.1 unnamed protein product [Rotaria sp. Silwood1]CAF3362633.1 unnamed protein product [Rotaria sp. Silwood1]CAF3363344.1 unnamed protein product [Rotaria sp. Silwood1]